LWRTLAKRGAEIRTQFAAVDGKLIMGKILPFRIIKMMKRVEGAHYQVVKLGLYNDIDQYEAIV
jgi:hypothetical protein